MSQVRGLRFAYFAVFLVAGCGGGTTSLVDCQPPCPASSTCDTSNGTCVPNPVDASVAGDLAMPECVPMCMGQAPYCTPAHKCVACLTDDNCAAGNLCKNSVCVPGCNDDARCRAGGMPQTMACCGGQCTDTATDGANCGKCATACNGGHASGMCAGGVCAFGTCSSGYGDCNMDPKDGCESNLHVDRNNCGKCGTMCSEKNAIAACADGCYLAACNFGYDDCNGDPMDGCETSVVSDPRNCGGCGMPCGAVAHAKVSCINAACQVTNCDQGFADCDNNAANGCEVAVGTDKSNCGACGNVCGANLVCTNGGCTCQNCNIPNAKSKCVNLQCAFDSCLPGFADCDNNQANGCEVNTNSDKNNCSACGKACPMGQSCVSGVCAKCNGNILVLGDDQAAADMNLVNAINNAGLNATLVASGDVNYAGNPAASNYGAVVILVGNNYANDMPAGGQAAIAQAVRGSTGLVLSEWGAYQVSSGRWQQLAPFILIPRSGGTTMNLTFTSTMQHPIWSGLPMTFKTVNSMGGNTGNALANGGVSIATCTECASQGVAVLDGGAGRVVQMSYAANYNAGGAGGPNAWTNDTNLTLMTINAIKWAARCM